MRCVFDTNAIISAMLSKTGTPGAALSRAFDNGEILVSVPLMMDLHGVVCRADWIVTGDADLLVLDPFRDIRIVKAADFVGLGFGSQSG